MLPALLYYGKIKGGDAVLMEMHYFRETHYPVAYTPVSELNDLAQQVDEFIRLEPAFTGVLRRRAIEQLGCTKSQFDTAIKELQISLNVVCSNDPSSNRSARGIKLATRGTRHVDDRGSLGGITKAERYNGPCSAIVSR